METVNITLAPYYYKFSDLNNFIYNLREVKGFYKIEQLSGILADEGEEANEFLIILHVGVNHKEIEMYYKDEETRNLEYERLSKLFLCEEED